MKVNRQEVRIVMGSDFHQTVYGKRFFDAQLPSLIKAINKLAEAIEKQNELKEEDKKNDHTKN